MLCCTRCVVRYQGVVLPHVTIPPSYSIKSVKHERFNRYLEKKLSKVNRTCMVYRDGRLFVMSFFQDALENKIFVILSRLTLLECGVTISVYISLQ